MKFKMKHSFLKSIFVMVVMLALAFPLSMTSSSAAEEKYPTWEEWGPKDSADKPVRGGYYRSAAVKYVGLMNPNHWPVRDWVALTQFYERLVYRDGNYKASIPWLAKSWEFIDPLTVITKLEEGVKFHDGSDFNAEAVKYQINWILDKKNGAWDRAYLRSLKSVEVLDEYTLKWTFKEPWAAFPGAVLAGIPGWPVSAEALKNDVALREVKGLTSKLKKEKAKLAKAEKKVKGGDQSEKAAKKLEKAKKKTAALDAELKAMKARVKGAKKTDQAPVGTGQFILEDARPGNYLKVKRNPNWWYGKKIGKPEMPYFDGKIITIIPDISVQLASLRAGKIDAMGIDKASYAMVKDDPNLNVHTYPFNGMVGLRFNLAKGPSKDIRVRKAVSHAIDRKALIVGTQFGLARIASGPFPEDHWCHNPELKPITYDPELSKKLLAEAGYPKGLTLKGYMGDTSTSVNVTEAIKAMLNKVGINWQVDSLDAAARSDRMKNLDYDLASGGYGYIWDPDLISVNLYHPKGGFNYGRSNNKKAIALIEAGKKEVDEAKRQKIYFDLEKVLYENYEDVWLWWHVSIVAYSKRVQGYNNDMYIRWREGQMFSHPLWFKEGKRQ
ncbi:MAG: ABC transporter substrate-binding protein [Candidatus Adiutricales bacterium]